MIDQTMKRLSAVQHHSLYKDLWLLAARLAVGAIFFLSARTKVEGFLTIKNSTFFLFENEYALPVLPYELAAYLATYAEHGLSLLLILGVATRLPALGLLGMTTVIQVFVYPSAWPTHLTWAALLIALVVQGGGHLSVDGLWRAMRTKTH
jgi:putative oxidoreductase